MLGAGVGVGSQAFSTQPPAQARLLRRLLDSKAARSLGLAQRVSRGRDTSPQAEHSSWGQMGALRFGMRKMCFNNRKTPSFSVSAPVQSLEEHLASWRALLGSKSGGSLWALPLRGVLSMVDTLPSFCWKFL